MLLPFRDSVTVFLFCCAFLCIQYLFCNHLDGEKRADFFALFVFLVSRDYFVPLPRGATGLSAFCDCGIS